MALHSLDNVLVRGIAACVPAEVFHISAYPMFSEQEKKDFSKHVGVKAKRHSNNKYTTSDLCLNATEQLLSELAWKKDEIGLLVLVSQSPDYLLPATSIILQDKLNLQKNTLSFDINLGCSGWVYGLSIVGSMMRALNISKAILLAGDTSILADSADKIAFPLMGDAGTATAMELSDNAGSMHFCLQSDGSGFTSIIAPQSGSRYLSSVKNAEKTVKYAAQLNPGKVLEFCLRNVAPSINSLLDFASTDIDAIHYFILHQANKIINDSIRKRLRISLDKLPYSIDNFGNTSSASIPLTLVTELKDQLKSGQLLLLCSGFGVGLSLANVLLRTDGICCPDLIEI